MASRTETALLKAPIQGGGGAPPKLDLDALMERLRTEVEARKLQAGSPDAASGAILGGRTAYSARLLLDLPEAEFVVTAHRAILRREADADEVGRHLDRLLLGEVTRAGLLHELMHSQAGREGGVKITGLWRAEQGERIRNGLVARLYFDFLQTLKTISLLPKRIAQFVRRVDGLEKRAAETALRIDALERALHDLNAAQDGADRTADGARIAPPPRVMDA